MNEKTLAIGVGGCGCRLAHLYSNFTKAKELLFNSSETDVEGQNVILLKDDKNKVNGSGRNPLHTLNNTCPNNSKKMKRLITEAVVEIEKIILFSSTGGGTGLPMLIYITENILTEIKIPSFAILVTPFQSEGIPQTSNSVRMIKEFTDKCMNIVTPLLLNNDDIFVEGERTTFDITNQSIVEFVTKLFDYASFVGILKKGSLSTLDENEFNRILEPSGGFLSIDIIPIDEFGNEKISKQYDLNTAKKMIVLFQTVDMLSMETVKKFDNMFPSPVKILAESTGKNKIKILSNGLELPITFKKNIKTVLKNIDRYKNKISKSKKNFKKSVRGISNRMLNL